MLRSLMVSLLVFTLVWCGGYAGKDAEELAKQTKGARFDLAIVLDDSDSVTDEDFEHMINVTRWLGDYFPVGFYDFRVTVITYSNEPVVLLGLTFRGEELYRLEHPPTRQRLNTRTHLALEMVGNMLNKTTRPFSFSNITMDIGRMVILFTDGEPNTGNNSAGGPETHPDFAPTERVAEKLREDGMIIYVVFVGDKINNMGVREHLNKVTGDSKKVFAIENFASLKPEIFSQIHADLYSSYSHSTKKPAMGQDPPRNDRSETEKDALPGWAVPVIVGVACLLVLAVIIGVAMGMRKKNRKVAAKKSVVQTASMTKSGKSASTRTESGKV